MPFLLVTRPQKGLTWLSQHLLTSTKNAKSDKQIERATMLARVVVLYCVDAPDEHLTWLSVSVQISVYIRP